MDTGPEQPGAYWELLGSHAAEIRATIILEENFLILLDHLHGPLDRIPPALRKIPSESSVALLSVSPLPV